MGKQLEKMGYASDGMKTPKFFEEWGKRNMMKPVCIVRDADGDILIADSHEPIRTLGIYRTGYAIHRSGLELANYNDYPMTDFASVPRKEGMEKRVHEALEHARQTQSQLKEAGYYDAERKGRFSLRPN